MRIITLNVNGIRAAGRKGFFHWLRRQRADVVCLQEIRAHQSQLDASVFR
ncbi:MAG: exodeoxyribonuclease III, partial [Gammaproteobacteria bacterium]|nr:exodeoxyribonuclease III [Gammaproteobacteria bacterium]